MLRRLSIHAAGLTEPKTTYVWEDLGAVTFEAGAAASFDKRKITRAMREYAIAGALHLDHLAALAHSPANAKVLALNAVQLSQAFNLALNDRASGLTACSRSTRASGNPLWTLSAPIPFPLWPIGQPTDDDHAS